MPLYDYIIIGAGAAGLSLADRFCDATWSDKKVLVIDEFVKSGNDRTWCGWYKSADRYDHLAIKKWKEMFFVGPGGKKRVLHPAPYVYRMLPSAPFYRHINDRIKASANVTFEQAAFLSHQWQGDKAEVVTSKGSFFAKHVFTSLPPKHIDKQKHVYTDQHFKGWFVEMAEDCFDEDRCTFMDFSIEQGDEVRFMYVLPTDKRRALVELAVFSTQIWSQEDYDAVIRDYIQKTYPTDKYTVKETEFGIIPMTSYPFHQNNQPWLTGIGTAGGAVKASSGFAFERIQRHCDAIMTAIKEGREPGTANRIFKARHSLYDATLLQVLDKKRYRGADFFETLFERNPASRVFDFLNEETTLWEEIQLMAGSPKHIFAWSMVERVVG